MENSYLNPNHDVFTRYKYLGNFIFENGRLDKVLFDGGYVKIRLPVLGYTNFWNNTVGTWLNNSVPSGPASKTTQKFIWTETIGF